MISIKQTKDINLIKSILKKDNVYDGLVYDNSPPIDKWTPDIMNTIWFALYDNQDLAGLIKLSYLNYVLWIPHVIIYKQFRGQGSEGWGKLAAQYMREVYGAKKFMAMTPYKNAKKYAEKIGFKHVHTLTKSIKKNGELLDQYILEME